jgi:glyoxylate reductase
MRVLYTDREPIPNPEPDAEFLALDDLLAASDVVSLHCPLTDDTRHLLDRRRLRLMPKGAVLINTARGPLVDEAALARQLERGRLGGAGLDVFELEPEVHPELLTRRDVVLLPHVGSATVETRAAMAELAARNVIAVLRGEEPPTPVVRGRAGAGTGGGTFDLQP